MHSLQNNFFIARQHAVHARTARQVLAIPSVCPVRHIVVFTILSKWMHISLNSPSSDRDNLGLFEPHRRYKIPIGTLVSRALNTRGGNFFYTFFDRSPIISDTVQDTSKPMVTMDY